MAVKVVQGLIDVTGKGGSSPQRASTASTSLTIQQQIQQASQTTVSAASQLLRGDAVVALVRTGVSTVRSDAGKVKDEAKARELAEGIAEKVRDKDFEALGAHDGLSGTKAREYFSQ